MPKTGSFFIGLFFVLTCFAAKEIQVETTVDRNSLNVGDTFTATVSIISNDSVEPQDPRLPDLEGMQLLNQWTSSSSSHHMVYEGGKPQFKSERRIDYHYMLAAKKTGSIKLGSFDVVVNGTSFKTRPIDLQVVAAGVEPRNQKNGSAVHPSGRPGSQGRAGNLPRGGSGLPGFDDEDSPFAQNEEEDLYNQLLKQREQILNQLGQGGLLPPGFGGSGNRNFANPAPNSRKLNVNTDEAFFIQTEIDKREAYEGEQITVSWYIYTRAQLETLDRLKFPNLKGFWKEIIEEVPSLRFEEEIVNGVPFKKALLASHALFPIKAGLAVVDEFKIKSRLRLLTNMGFTNPLEYTKTSKPIEIKVKALPLEGRPKSFSGAVGDFSVRVFVENPQVKLGEPLSLKVRFEGNGNAKLIELPDLQLPASFENYDTKSEARFFKNGTSYKEFTVVVVPKEVGHFKIPAIKFGMFNVSTKSYETKESEPLEIEVLNGTMARVDKDIKVKTNEAEKNGAASSAASDPSTPDLYYSYQSSSLFGGLPVNSKLALQGILLAIALLILGGKAFYELRDRDKQKTMKQVIEQRLKRIERDLSQEAGRIIGTEVTNIYYYVLGEVSGVGGANQQIEKLLETTPSSLRREYGEKIIKNFGFFQLLTFAPEDLVHQSITAEKLREELKIARELFRRIADSYEEIHRS